MKRIFANKVLHLEDIFIIENEDAHHLLNVMRVKVNDELNIVDREENLYLGKIEKCIKGSIFVKILSKINKDTETKNEVVLALSLLKGEKMEFVIQKAVELGIKTIVPIKTKNAIPKYDKIKEDKKIEKWQKIIVSAAKQSGRNTIPNILSIKNIDYIKENFKDYTKIICYENAKDKSFLDINFKDNNKYLLLIGPEGGFSLDEIHQLEDDFYVISLGSRILRAETASIAAISILMYELGEIC